MAHFIKLAPSAEPLEDKDYVLVDGLQVIYRLYLELWYQRRLRGVRSYHSRDEAMTAAKELAAKHGIEKLYIRERRDA